MYISIDIIHKKYHNYLVICKKCCTFAAKSAKNNGSV